jgi:hypothetical protein
LARSRFGYLGSDSRQNISRDITITQMKKLSGTGSLLLLLASCGTPPPKNTAPPLDPQQAGQLLQFSTRAQNWLKVVRKQNPGCDYQLQLPDQSAHPTSIDLTHIIRCQGQPAPKEFDASVSFEWNAAEGHWVIRRFTS